MKKQWAACEVELAVTEWLLERGHPDVITHFYPHWWHECDVYSITKAGYGIETEVKISVADFKAEFRKTRKHQALAAAVTAGCPPGFAIGVPRRYYFAVPEGLIGLGEIPDYAGLLYIRRHEETKWRQERVSVAVVLQAPTIHAAKKVTPDQLQTLSVAYKFHYYSLLRRLAKTLPGKER